MKIITTTLAIAALTMTGVSATATQASESQASIAVATSDLDLSTVKGTKTLKLRIHRAATELCGDLGGSAYAEQRKFFRACYQNATQPAFASAQAKSSAKIAAR